MAKVGSNNGSEEAGGEEEEEEERLRIAVEETEGSRRLIGEQGGNRRGEEKEEGNRRGLEVVKPTKLHLGLSNSLEVIFLIFCFRAPKSNSPLGSVHNVSSALQMEESGDIAVERAKPGENHRCRGNQRGDHWGNHWET